MPNVKIKNRNPEKELNNEELEIFKKCTEDIIEFTKYVEINNVKKGWVNFYENLFPKQKEILIDLQKNWDSKFFVFLSPRQSGKTLISTVFILWLLITTSGSNIAIVANKKDTAKRIFRRFIQMYRRLPDFLKLSKEVGDSKSELELADGSLVSVSATTFSGLRNESATLLYMDEVAWIQSEELKNSFWTSNYPILESRGTGGFIGSSTPKGKGELFHSLYLKTQKNDPSYDTKWKLIEIKWWDVFNRDEKWKEQKIKDLSINGKNGADIFEQEYNNSFEVISDVSRFFNQDAISKLFPRQELFTWAPNKEYIGPEIKIYDRFGSQHFVIGMDFSEGRGLNFSSMVGLSVIKKQSINNSDLTNFEIRQAFQLMDSQISLEDFFNLSMYFLITQLNDQWFLIFELNDIGRVFSTRLEYLISELLSNELSAKNQIFKDILLRKFDNDNRSMVDYLTRRIYRTTGKKRANFGFKSEKHTNPLLKNNLKTLVDTGKIILYDNHIIEEMRMFEDKKGGETLNFSDVVGVSHFDSVQALKFCAWPLRDSSTIKDIMNISPIQSKNESIEGEYLKAILAANSYKSPTDFLKEEKKSDNINQLKDNENIPLTYREIVKDKGDITSLWERYPVWFRKK